MTDQPKDTRLWCLHHIGADEVHPAPDFSTAQMWADWANKQFSEHADISRFVVAVWPHSAERHAAWLIKALDEWTLPEQPVDAKREALAAAIRALPYDVMDDYDEVRRDERERIIAALATNIDTIGSHFGNGGGFDPVARDIGAVAWMLRSNETGEVIFDEVCVWRDRESAEDAVAEIDPELMDYSADAVPFPVFDHPPHPAHEVEGLGRAVEMARETMSIPDDGSDANLHRAHVHAAWVVKLAGFQGEDNRP